MNKGPLNLVGAEPPARHPAPMSAVEFHDFYVQHRTKLMAYLTRCGCPRSHVDDMIQDAFVLAWQHRNTFRGDSPFGGYLKGIAKNLLRNAHRSGILHPSSQIGANHSAPLAHTDVKRNELIEQMREHLAGEQWQIVDFVYLRRMTISDAAREIGCTPAILYNRLSRAKKNS
jgi:RNA polymerase sigma factor (sigma-70 family)